MSSRLLGMKFMQRKVASDASNPSPTTPSSSHRPSKRQRLSTDAAASSPATPKTSEQQIIADYNEAEERKRQAVIDRAAAEAGETKWVLSVQAPAQTPPVMRVVTAGYGAIDTRDVGLEGSEDEDEEKGVVRVRPALQGGRRSWGKFNKIIERQTNPDLSSSEEDEKDSDDSDEDDEDDDVSDDDEDDDPASVLIKQQRRAAAENLRKQRKAKQKSDREQLDLLAKERRKKEIKLNQANGGDGGGISSGGRQAPSRGPLSGKGNLRDMTCHKCGNKGHMMKDCPERKEKKMYEQRGARRTSGMEY